MLEDVPDLTLAMLNEATQAWVELEYNRKLHSEIGEAPVARFLKGPEVTRQSPDSAALRLAFTRTEQAVCVSCDGSIDASRSSRSADRTGRGRLDHGRMGLGLLMPTL